MITRDGKGVAYGASVGVSGLDGGSGMSIKVGVFMLNDLISMFSDSESLRGGCKETSLGGAAFSSYDEGCKGFKCVQERAFLRDTTLLTVFTQTDSLLQRR